MVWTSTECVAWVGYNAGYSMQDIYYISKSSKPPAHPIPQNPNGPPAVEKRQIPVCKQLFIPFSYYSKNQLDISKFVQLFSGNLALNKAISFERSHIDQPRRKTRRNCKTRNFICCAVKPLALQSFLIPPLGMGAKF